MMLHKFIKATACIALLLFFANDLSAQAVPQRFNYSTQVTDAAGLPITNRFIRMRATLHTGSGTGPITYVEIDTGTTSKIGIFTVVIGGGSIQQGSFLNIPWASGAVYFQVEMDVNGGTNYVNMGSAQLISYPYALVAGNGAGALSFDSTGKAAVNTTDGLSVLKTTRNAWLTTGNAAVGTGFIGTIDATDVVMKRNNVEGLRLGANKTVITGNTGIGVAAPVTSMEINGALTLRDTAISVSGNFTLNVGNRSMITITSSKRSDQADATLSDGLVNGQLLMVVVKRSGNNTANGITFNASNNMRLPGTSQPLLDGNTITFIWDGADWLQTSVSLNN